MAKMIKCKKCGVKFEKSDELCPGCNTDYRSFFSKHKKITLSLFLAILITMLVVNYFTVYKHNGTFNFFFFSIGSDNHNGMKAIKIEASDLVSEYSGNIERANKKYQEKLVKVTGMITKMDSSYFGTYIILDLGVKCKFYSSKDYEKASTYKVGNIITVEGIVKDKYEFVTINDCHFGDKK